MKRVSQSDPLEKYYDVRDSQLLKVELKPTLLPFCGMGLFATGEIQKGEIIAEYYGSILTAEASQSTVFNEQSKMLELLEDYCIISRGPASRINDIVNLKIFTAKQYEQIKKNRQFPNIEGCAVNAMISYENKLRVFIKSTRNIQTGEQIYISYGFHYWREYYELVHAAEKVTIG